MIQSLYLKNFRSYKEKRFFFSPRINWIVGENAKGKTNLLEALSLLSIGRSFRTLHLFDLIREGEKSFFLEAQFVRDGTSQTLSLRFDGQSKQMYYNATHYSHFTPLIGLLPIVFLLPEDSGLISGTPAYRRRFLNLHIAQADLSYVQHLIRYTQALNQRNALLRSKSTLAIDPWEEVMALSASILIEMRFCAIEDLSPSLLQILSRLSGGIDELKCSYQSSIPFDLQGDVKKALKEHWRQQREKEMQFGTTLAGPHRDDCKLSIGKKPAKLMASEGQKQSIAAALRLAEWQRLQSLTGYPPLFCIDDFGTHLDLPRQSHLQKELRKLTQVFLTTQEIPLFNPEETILILSDKE